MGGGVVQIVGGWIWLGMTTKVEFMKRKDFVRMKLRKAEPNEVELCYQCIEDARAYHKSLGFEQWRPEYPTRQTILDDIARNTGYVFVNEQGVVGYCCVIIGDEPAYQKIEGAWKTDRPYAVVHRMAFNRKVRGGGLKLAYEWDNNFPMRKDE